MELYISEERELDLNLKSLSDEKLINDTEQLVKEERALLTSILHHLREIERRRLFSKLACSSLFDYAVKKLGYSEDQAARRISAMRLLRDLPELEEKINFGALSLTHLGLAQTLFHKEQKLGAKPFSKNEKLDLLNRLEGKSTREAEKIVVSMSSQPEAFRKDSVRTLTAVLSEIRFTASDELLQKIEKLKGLRAHVNPGASLAELFEDLCNLGLKQWDPAAKNSSIVCRTKSLSSPAAPRVRPRQNDRVKKISISQAAIRRQVWLKAKSKCQNCDSTYALEIDHILPRARGGDSSAENLRLLCRGCNQRAAIEAFGIQKMENYLEKR